LKKTALLIFIKNAEKGKVKTRLASTVGDEKALKIYQALLGHTRKVASAIDTQRFVYYSSFVEENDDWSTTDFYKKVQTGGSLGERMKNAFQAAFLKHQKVLIVGSDCPTLIPDILETAYRQLDQHDFVIGPAIDGGYYLLGMSYFEPSLFEGIPWSTIEVLPMTIEKINDLDKEFYLLPTLSDVDYEEDWLEYGWELEEE